MLPTGGAFPLPRLLIVAPNLRLPYRLDLLDQLRHTWLLQEHQQCMGCFGR
jgi:hypothetical protein